MPRGGRPRSPEADRALRAATLQLLQAHGYANLTMSGVAAAAGVSSATLYRRWSSKLELVVDVLQAWTDERPVRDTGSLRGDCRAFLTDLIEAMRTTPAEAGLSGLIGEIGRNPELALALRTHLVAPRRAALRQMLERASARGEIRPRVDYDVVIDLLTGALYQRRLITGAPVSPRLADQLTDLIVRAVVPEPERAPASSHRRRTRP